MTTHYLTDLMEKSDATAHGFKMLEPNCGPTPNRVCRMCEHYREGGICDKAKHGVTSALEPADDKQCFTQISGSPKVMVPEVNDTPVRERMAKTIARYQSKAAKEKRAAKYPADPTPTTRICQRCGRELPLSEFAKTKGGGRRYTCRDCQHESFVAAGFKSHKPGAVSVKEVAKVEQVQRTIDKALALGLEKVAQCLAEAAQAMEGIAKELNQ